MSSWLRCNCGHLLHTNLFAGAGVLKLIRDEDFDQLDEPFDTEAVRELFMHGATAYRCSQCGRLHVQWQRGNEPTSYLLEPLDLKAPPST